MSYYNVYAGFGSGSKKLPGAISPKQSFEDSSVDKYVPSKFYVNEDFYYDENGAVLNAFRLSPDAKQKAKEISIILSIYLENHPEYEIEVLEGEFPIYLNRVSPNLTELETKTKSIAMSNYILYIKNYQEYLKKQNTNKEYIK